MGNYDPSRLLEAQGREYAKLADYFIPLVGANKFVNCNSGLQENGILCKYMINY